MCECFEFGYVDVGDVYVCVVVVYVVELVGYFYVLVD